MPSFEVHQLGIELEGINGYLKPEFPPEGNNSADFYDYGNGLLLGAALGVGRLRKLARGLIGHRAPGSALTNFEVALDSAFASLTDLQNDPAFDIHKSPKVMATIVRMLHALTAFHAHSVGKQRMY